MSAGRNFAISFAINAVMGASFAATVARANGSFQQLGKEAGTVTRQFSAASAGAQGYLSKLRQIEAQAAGFASLKRAIGDTEAALNQARDRCGVRVG